MTLTFPQRMISGTYLVRDVVMTVDSDQKARYEYTFLEGAEHQSSWTDRMRQAVGRGGLNAPGGTISGGIIPNFSGRFDGDVVAHAGKPQKEVIVGEIPTEGSYGSGPGILMNRNPDLVGGRGGWGIVSDQVSGSRALWFQDRSQSAVAQYTWRIVQYGTNWYALHAATGVTLELGSNSNRLGKVVSNGVSVGPEIAGGSGQLSVSHPALPIIDMTENSGPVNQKTWRIISFGQVFQLQTVNDAYTSATTVMNVDRNGNWGCTGEAFVARLMMPDGIGNPGATPGWARIFVDAADGDLKVVFGDGVTKTIATDT